MCCVQRGCFVTERSRDATSMQVHVSAALYGNEIAMLTLLSELERHVQPNLTVVHISKGSPTLSAANLRQWELAPNERSSTRTENTCTAAGLRCWSRI